MQRFYRKYRRNGYVLKCDITNFFGSTPHSVVKEKMRKYCKDDWAYSELCKIIDSFGSKDNPEIGMGLGSQVTQLCQLAVLNDLDHAIKERMRIKHYVRYNDDFLLIHESKDKLRECLAYIRKEFKNMGLTLSEKKTQTFPLTQNINFLGCSFLLTETGKVIKKILPKKVTRERRRLKRMCNLVREGKMSISKLDNCFNSWLSLITGEPSKNKKARPYICRNDNYFMVQKMKKFYRELRCQIE